MKPYTNELHDVSSARAAEMGFVLPSFGEAEVMEGEAVSGRGMLEALCGHALPNLPLQRACEMCGARVVVVLMRLGARLDGRLMARARRVSDVRWVSLPQMAPEIVEVLKVLIIGERRDLSGIGRWFMLVAYALCPNPLTKAVLRNVEHIGELWELKARNKRSAVSAAMRVLKAELKRHWRFDEEFHFWFEKSAAAKAVYARVQEGNENRRGGGMTNEEGRMTNDCGAAWRRRIERLEREAEARRMARLCGCEASEIDVRKLSIAEGTE